MRAFSLTELLVVLVIIGILVLVAMPNLMPLISRAKATEAQQQLTFLHSLEKSYFYTYSRYSDDLEELGFEQASLVTDGGNANYEPYKRRANRLAAKYFSKNYGVNWFSPYPNSNSPWTIADYYPL